MKELASQHCGMTFQIAEVNKILASVSRIVEGGNRVVFDNPQIGSYIENKTNGNRTYLRQANGVYYMDVWVSPETVEGFQRPGQ